MKKAKSAEEISQWRRYWKDRGYTLIRLKLADDALAKRSFWEKNVENMYWLRYDSVRPKRGKLWGSVDCIKVVSLGSYHPSPWHIGWFKNVTLTP